MVLVDERRELFTALSGLIEGQITNQEFDDLYGAYGDGLESADRAITVIAGFGYSLYSDIGSYRLTGWYAVDAETRAVAKRCLSFLQTDLEYSWPPNPSQTLRHVAGGCAFGLGIPLGIALVIVAALLGIAGPLWPAFAFLPLAAAVVLAISVYCWRWGALVIVATLLAITALWLGSVCLGMAVVFLATNVLLFRWSARQDTPAWRKYWAAGDREVWPFLRRADYNGAANMASPGMASQQDSHSAAGE